MPLNINGQTKLVGLIGYPVKHSLSPVMHNSAFAALNLNWCYVSLPVLPESLGEARAGLEEDAPEVTPALRRSARSEAGSPQRGRGRPRRADVPPAHREPSRLRLEGEAV